MLDFWHVSYLQLRVHFIFQYLSIRSLDFFKNSSFFSFSSYSYPFNSFLAFSGLQTTSAVTQIIPIAAPVNNNFLKKFPGREMGLDTCFLQKLKSLIFYLLL